MISCAARKNKTHNERDHSCFMEDHKKHTKHENSKAFQNTRTRAMGKNTIPSRLSRDSLTRVGFFRLEFSLRIISIPPLAAMPILQHSLPKSIPITDMVLAYLLLPLALSVPASAFAPTTQVPREIPTRLPAKSCRGSRGTRRDKIGQRRTGPDRTGQDRAGQARAGHGRTGQDRTGQDKDRT